MSTRISQVKIPAEQYRLLLELAGEACRFAEMRKPAGLPSGDPAADRLCAVAARVGDHLTNFSAATPAVGTKK